jgi:hypothetical protein
MSMSSSSTLLAQPRLSIITRHSDAEMSRIQNLVEHKVLVDGRCELEALLGELLSCAERPSPKTLDLIGHSTADDGLLQLGDWVIDSARSTVTAFFRELADNDVLPRLGVHAVRLLGCRTAETAHGRTTICALADILGLEVYGTTGLLFANHYDARGFHDEWRFLLTGASDLRHTTPTQPPARSRTTTRVLDIDALPAVPADALRRYPRRIANEHAARSLLRLVRRNEGAIMPGLLTLPQCEVALPADEPGAYRLAQVLLDGQFVRVYPDGAAQPGVLFPVTDPFALQLLVEKLPAA